MLTVAVKDTKEGELINDSRTINGNVRRFDFADFGQEIFLTKEEAEENLKKIRGK